MDELESKARQIGAEGDITDVQCLQKEVLKLKDTLKRLQKEAATSIHQLQQVVFERGDLKDDLLRAIEKLHQKQNAVDSCTVELGVSVESVESALAHLKSTGADVLPLCQTLMDRVEEQTRKLLQFNEPIPLELSETVRKLETARDDLEASIF